MAKKKEEEEKKEGKEKEQANWYADFEGEKELFTAFIKRNIEKHPVVINHHGKWKELIAWADKGEQFSEWDTDTSQIRPVKLLIRKKRVVVNLMKPLIEAVNGKIDLSHSIIGLPNSTELSDIEASRVSTKFLKSNDEINRIDSIMEAMSYDLYRTGNAAINVLYDATEHGSTIVDKAKNEDEGEVILRVPSIFNLRPDPTARSWQDMRWIIEVMEVTLDDLKRTFPDITKTDLEQERLSTAIKYTGMNEPEAEKDKDEDTWILAGFRQRSNWQFPQGRYALIVGNNVLYIGPNKNPKTHLGYFFFGFKRCESSFWHTGPLHHVQPIQREFNRFLSIISEELEAWRPKMLIPHKSLARQGSYTTDSFELLEYFPDKGPLMPLQTPTLGAEIFNYTTSLIDFFDKVSNIHEVSYARLPKYATRSPAQLYGMMLEQEDAKLNPMLRPLNDTLLEMDRFRLMLMGKYYKTKRMVKTMGTDDTASIGYFSGAELAENYDVRLDRGVSIHQSPLVQQRLLIELFQSGAIEDRNKLFKLLNMGTLEYDLRSDVIDEKRALRENQAFIDGTYDKDFNKGGVQVYIHDNHPCHLDYHSNLAKSEEAQRWKQERFDALNYHMAQHFVFFMQMQQMASQETRQKSPQAAPSEPPQVSPPGGVM